MPSFRSFTCRTALVALIALVGGVATVQAQEAGERGDNPPRAERSPPRSSEDGGHRSSMSDSVRRVRNQTGGQVLSVERMQYDGREVNRVKYVDDRGRVRTMDDAGGARRSDSRVRSPRDVPSPSPARGDNPSRP
ncbi:hypothetical protein [Pseudoxanthomonas putridarboris]|uniref:Secreted protein n=1 Tax=Pseudoxanthomonas putridarboris TaxID=752605 RepID=A0ABU9IWR3_9GAMM